MRLDDLHPGRRDHAAEQHVEQHHDADDDHGRLVRNAEHQRDEVAGADHLRDRVEEQRQDAADRRGDPDRRLLQPERDDIGKGELAEVAQRLGDEEHQRRPADQPPGGVDHPVVAAQRDQAGDAEERRGAHVVAGQRQAVLQRADAAAGRVEIGRRPRPARRPVGDRQRQRDDQQEEARSRRPSACRASLSIGSTRGRPAQSRSRSRSRCDFGIVVTVGPDDVDRRQHPGQDEHGNAQHDAERRGLADPRRQQARWSSRRAG